MSELVDGTTYLYDTITIDKQSGTVVTFDTDGKYIPKDIKLTLNVQSGSVSISNVSVTANPTISFNDETGVVTASISTSENISGTISSGFVSSGSTSGTASISGYSTYTIPIATINETKAYLGIPTS